MPAIGESGVYTKDELLVRKYALSPISNLKAFLQLDLEIYRKVMRLFPASVAFGLNTSVAESLVSSYLQDFQEAAKNYVDLLRTNEAEFFSHVLRNQLAIYRTFWRFENYIKKIVRLTAEQLGLAFSSMSTS